MVAGRFRVERKLAAGGMGVVYLAEQVPLGRRVALKILDTQQLDEERARNFGERFFLEATAVANLQHPNTITVHDFGKTDDDIYYYAMEFVDGASMSRYVHTHGPLTPAAVIHVGVQICGSLREAHRSGLIHRDLKPGNIMLAERHDDPLFVKVLDFGLVKVMGDEEIESSDLTQSGMLLGSPRYMAPEQVLRFELDPRCDVYSLGGVLYHALTGLPPFRHGSQFELLRAQVEEQPEPFADVCEACEATPRLEALVLRMLEKDRADRPQDMAEVAAELVACAREIGLEEISLSGALARASGSTSLPSVDSVSEEISAVTSAAALSEPTEATSQLRGPSLLGEAKQTSPAPPEEPESAVEPSPSARRIWLMLALVALFAAGGGVFAVAFFGMPADAEPPAAQGSVEPVVVAEPAADPEPVDPTPSPEPSEPATVRIETEPPGARIRHGEEDLGDAPFSLELPAGERWELEVSLEGHETRTVFASPGRDVLRVRLTPTPEAETPPVRQTPPHVRRRVEPRSEPEPADPSTTEPQFQDRGDLRHPWGRPR